MKKISYVVLSIIFFSLVISCEKDFKEIGGNVISNNEFNTTQIELDITITPENLDAVRADNLNIGSFQNDIQYWLGVYNNPDYKTIKSSFVSQLNLSTVNPKVADVVSAQSETEQSRKIDSIYNLDAVILKIPYTATNIRQSGEALPKFRLDSLLGDASTGVTLNIFQNDTFLNTLNPNNPSEGNTFLSNKDYTKKDMTMPLNAVLNYSFSPSPNDTMYVFSRSLVDVNGIKTTSFNDTIRLKSSGTSSIIDPPDPFLAIPLDLDKMKSLFWDQFSSDNFANQNNLNNYFRGLLIEIDNNSNDGAMVPIQLAGTTASASLEFYHTVSLYEIKEGATDLTFKDTIQTSFSFPLSGVRNSIYKVPAAQKESPPGSFIIQGTAGSVVKIQIDEDQLKALRDRDVLINDASLIFNIDASRDTTHVPLRVFAHRNDGEHIKDSYSEPITFGGALEYDEEVEPRKPVSYRIRITDYISDYITGETNENPELVLKVFNNPTDFSINPNTRVVDTEVQPYNWNPRGITLFAETASDTEKKAKLVISFTEEKETN